MWLFLCFWLNSWTFEGRHSAYIELDLSKMQMIRVKVRIQRRTYILSIKMFESLLQKSRFNSLTGGLIRDCFICALRWKIVAISRLGASSVIARWCIARWVRHIFYLISLLCSHCVIFYRLWNFPDK